MVLQAGVAALLTRLGAGTDIPIGSPIAGRTDGALDDLVGFFVNTLVLRTDTAGNPSFRELIARVRATNLAAYGHQELPFERLVEVVNPARSLARHPLFQVMLAFQNNPPAGFDLPGLTTAFEPVAATTAKFDLSVSLGEQRCIQRIAGWDIDGVLEYATDLFDRATVEALARRLMRLLEAAVASTRSADRQPRHSVRRRSATPFCASGTTPRVRCRLRRCPSCLPPRRPGARTRPRWCSKTCDADLCASSMPAPISWRIICRVSASAPRWWSGCASSARWR